MKTERFFLLALTFLLGLTLRTTAQNASPAVPILGAWLNEAQNAQITFTQAPDQTYTAAVTWVKPGANAALKPGSVVVKGLKRKKDEYIGGQLYAAKRSRWVTGAARLVNPKTLELKGSVGLMNQTQTWTRVAAN